VRKPSLNAAQPYAKAEGRVFLLVPAYPGCPGTKAVKWLLLFSQEFSAKRCMKRESIEGWLTAGEAITSPPPGAWSATEPRAKHFSAFKARIIRTLLGANYICLASEFLY